MWCRSIRLPDIGEGEDGAAAAAAEGRPGDRALTSKISMARQRGSYTGSDGSGSIAAGRSRGKVRACTLIVVRNSMFSKFKKQCFFASRAKKYGC
jgi:hypothetical protein